MEKREFEDVKNVGQLKEVLKDVPDDYRVVSEGCDCDGTMGAVTVSTPYTRPRDTEETPGEVYLHRQY